MVCRLLSNRWTKHRLTSSCFSNGPSRVFSQEIGAFKTRVKTSRWGEVLAASLQTLEIQYPIRQFWNLGLYSGGRDLALEIPDYENGAAAEGYCDAHLCDAAIKSTFFWGFMAMIDILALLVLEMSGWSDDCDCHSSDRTFGDLRSRRRDKSYYRKQFRAPCIMSGRRAGSWAAGVCMVCVFVVGETNKPIVPCEKECVLVVYRLHLGCVLVVLWLRLRCALHYC